MQNSAQLIVQCSQPLRRRVGEENGIIPHKSVTVCNQIPATCTDPCGKDQSAVSIPLMPFALATHRLYLEIEYPDGTRSLRNVCLCCASSAPKYKHLYCLGITFIFLRENEMKWWAKHRLLLAPTRWHRWQRGFKRFRQPNCVLGPILRSGGVCEAKDEQTLCYEAS